MEAGPGSPWHRVAPRHWSLVPTGPHPSHCHNGRLRVRRHERDTACWRRRKQLRNTGGPNSFGACITPDTRYNTARSILDIVVTDGPGRARHQNNSEQLVDVRSTLSEQECGPLLHLGASASISSLIFLDVSSAGRIFPAQSRPNLHSFPAAAAETEGIQVVSQIVDSPFEENGRPSFNFPRHLTKTDCPHVAPSARPRTRQQRCSNELWPRPSCAASAFLS